MGSIMNGIAVHGGTRPYGGTFLAFSDYMRGAVRLSALMRTPVIYVWTHDSIGLGEDGPTHQPIEHVAALRAIPGLDVVRPADANETAGALGDRSWRTTTGPAGLILSRQNLPIVPRGERRLRRHLRGRQGRLRAEGQRDGTPDVILIGTGSEVQLAVARRRAAGRRRASPPGSSRCPAGSGSTSRTRRTATRSSRRTVKARVSVEAGIAWAGATIVGDAGRIVSHQPLRRQRRRGHAVRASSASPPTPWPPPPGRASPAAEPARPPPPPRHRPPAARSAPPTSSPTPAPPSAEHRPPPHASVEDQHEGTDT